MGLATEAEVEATMYSARHLRKVVEELANSLTSLNESTLKGPPRADLACAVLRVDLAEIHIRLEVLEKDARKLEEALLVATK